MLEALGLRRSFGDVVALDGLDMEIRAGRVTGFLGPNGAGKTTTMRAILGLTSVDAGEILYDGRPITRPDRRRFGYMPEERGLWEDMPILEQIVLLGRLRGADRVEVEQRAAELFARVGLGDRTGDKAKALSQGNQHRAQLVAALVSDPAVLILDEPFSGLDPIGVDTMAEILADEAGTGRTVLFSSHQLDLVEDLCEHVVIVNKGRVVVSGPVRELTTAGDTRLVVEVDGDHIGRWADAVDGVEVSERSDGAVRLILHDVDSQAVLVAAQRAGPVRRFTTERRRLSEVFREATAARGGAR